MSSNYVWITTKDNIDSEAVGTIGPSDAPEELDLETIKKHPSVERFRLLDDDGEIYAYGLFIDFTYGETVHGFEPLDDWGAPNYGATSIEYKEEKGDGEWGEWVML